MLSSIVIWWLSVKLGYIKLDRFGLNFVRFWAFTYFFVFWIFCSLNEDVRKVFLIMF